jgi:DNA-binding transcriptional ArsR family regulator
VHPANITHHFKLLEKNGLIRLVEKRDIGKNIEKYYRAIAYAFIIKPSDASVTNKNALALSILKNDLSVAINTVEKETDSKKIAALLSTAKIEPEKVQHFIGKLMNLVEEFKACDSSYGYVYNINLSLYPNDVDCISKNNIKVEIK